MADNTLPEWKRRLGERGILQAAVNLGWTICGQGWMYPVWDAEGIPLKAKSGKGVYRVKAFDSQASPKYRWEPSSKIDPYEPPLLYYRPGLDDAIRLGSPVQGKKGVAFKVSGEPDALTLMMVGEPRSVSSFGEMAFHNAPTIAAVKALGVETLFDWPDVDETGIRACALNYAAYREANAEYVAYDLGQTQRGFDLNKLFVQLGFSKPKFWEVLWNCPPIPAEKLLQHIPKSNQVQVVKPAASLWDGMEEGRCQDAVWEAIEDAVEAFSGAALRYEGEWSQNVVCPFHDDKVPSFGLHDHTGYKCFACGTGGWKKLAERFGVDYKSIIKADLPPLKPSSPKPPVKGEAPKFAITRLRDTPQHDDRFGLPLPMPFRTIQSVGGFARSFSRSKVAVIVGVSGGYKTSFVETIIMRWLVAGYSGTLDSREWNNVEHRWRNIQKLSGVSFETLMDDDCHQKWEKLGCPAGKWPGVAISTADAERVAKANAEIAKWAGDVYYCDPGYAENMTQVLEQMDEHCRLQKQVGKSMDFEICDYLQMYETDDADALNLALTQFKKHVIKNNTVGIMVSQTRKDDTQRVYDGGTMGQEAMHGARTNTGNLVMHLWAERDSDHRKTGVVIVDVVKNSIGTEERKKLSYDPLRMLIKDGV